MAGAKDLAEGNEHKQRRRERIHAHVIPLDRLHRPLLVLEEQHQVVIEDFVDELLVLLAPLHLAVQCETSLFGE